ncbi:MAG TPA: hypothetical protein VFQ00_09720 [Terriglobales bacterium]|nr:hypothetical protein [Terriglobales bacterium]
MRSRFIVFILSLFLFGLTSISHAQLLDPTQMQSPQFPRPPRTLGVDRPDEEGPKDPAEEKMEHEREKALNKQRQTSLQKDTDKLLQLATQLKQYVDKSNEHTMSLDVIKKADEIEKLAKSVKEKMKGSY